LAHSPHCAGLFPLCAPPAHFSPCRSHCAVGPTDLPFIVFLSSAAAAGDPALRTYRAGYPLTRSTLRYYREKEIDLGHRYKTQGGTRLTVVASSERCHAVSVALVCAPPWPSPSCQQPLALLAAHCVLAAHLRHALRAIGPLSSAMNRNRVREEEIAIVGYGGGCRKRRPSCGPSSIPRGLLWVVCWGTSVMYLASPLPSTLSDGFGFRASHSLGGRFLMRGQQPRQTPIGDHGAGPGHFGEVSEEYLTRALRFLELCPMGGAANLCFEPP
jgi:hypothetical protein